jgi:hypothetical protein
MTHHVGDRLYDPNGLVLTVIAAVACPCTKCREPISNDLRERIYQLESGKRPPTSAPIRRPTFPLDPTS